jgi:hypothetical protein
VQDAEKYFEPFKFSWHAVGSLSDDKFTPASTLLENIENGLLSYLDDKWGIAIESIEKIRKTDKFKPILKLNPFLPLSAPALVGTVTQPLPFLEFGGRRLAGLLGHSLLLDGKCQSKHMIDRLSPQPA